MLKKRVKNNLSDRRDYIRVHTVFPVELFAFDTKEGGQKKFIQGFTSDISNSGLRLNVNHPPEESLPLIVDRVSEFKALINLPFSRHPVEATVVAVWHEISHTGRFDKLAIGFSFKQIAPRDRRRMVNLAMRLKWLPRISVLSILLLLFSIFFMHYQTLNITAENSKLVSAFQEATMRAESYKDVFLKIEEEYSRFRSEIDMKDQRRENVSAKLGEVQSVVDITDPRELIVRKELERELNDLRQGKAILEKKLENVVSRRQRAENLLERANIERKLLGKATLRNMYAWIRNHQNVISGLIMSFEGDPTIKNWGFTYDQALAAQVFLLSGDFDRARKILSFFKDTAAKSNGGFFNAYNVISGRPAERIVHHGPNIWIAIAAVQYTDRKGDRKYLSLAENIAKWVMQNKDSEGGLCGGPGLGWYSTEHNLDAYALFNMLYDLTGNKQYLKERESTLKWLKEHTYSPELRSMKRGKGDSTIATDTMAWAISAIGPARLFKEQMDPDAIIRFAVKHCKVTTTFTRPDGEKVSLTGFDFSKAQHIPRGGIVSSEWTAQMILAFRSMAKFYYSLGEPEKGEKYDNKADFYLKELDKMVISSPSRSGQGAGCLPYASQPEAPTGHGWRTPKGKDTGSVAGTAYTIFAKNDFNPLKLDD